MKLKILTPIFASLALGACLPPKSSQSDTYHAEDYGTYTKYKDRYTKLWETVKLRQSKIAELDDHVNKIVANKALYISVHEALKKKYPGSEPIPWFLIGVIHGMEAGFKKNGHLHNGDPLSGYTYNVPANRPKVGHAPPFTFLESAMDAIKHQDLHHWNNWSSPAVVAFTMERFNGFGYYSKGINSPYLWSYTNHYSAGKYYADGLYDYNLVSAQAGTMAMIKRAEERGVWKLGQGSGSPVNQKCLATPINGTPVHVRNKPAPNGQILIDLNKATEIYATEMTEDGNWYAVNFILGGKKYGQMHKNPAWVYKTQLDCTGFAKKTCRADTVEGELIPVYSAPKDSSTKRIELKPNAQLQVGNLDSSGLFFDVTFILGGVKYGIAHGRPSYVRLHQLDCSGKPITFKAKTCAVSSISGEDIRVRSMPHPNAPIIQVLPKTAKVESLMRSGQWHAVQFTLNGQKFGVMDGKPAFMFSGQVDCP